MGGINIKRIYLLDTNIILTIWEKESNLLDVIESSALVDFKVTNDCFVELGHYVPDLDAFLNDPHIEQILRHSINNDVSSMLPSHKENRLTVKIENEIYSIVGNKVSATDYSLLVMCQNYSHLTLVTDDKRLLKNARRIVPPIQFLDLKGLISDLEQLGIQGQF